MQNFFKKKPGFTLIELLLVIGISTILLSFTTINLAGFQRSTSLSAEINKFIADLKEQQIKAMVGDGSGSGIASDYGIRIETTKYSVFRSTYATGNYSVTLPATIQITTTFPVPNDIIFQKGGGNIASFDPTKNTIILRNISTNEQKTITINKYGVITGVN